ncbi:MULTISPECIES: sugar ABC transporter permease [unclassified Enterococcus]|uniref:carbohydrate ABC transporter permease n=1 Tax=unclassified Enterococcus TaxID=2608891 RepID=UPI0015557F81|nr:MULTISPECIES: sugar ABC transporter permease [unclassified Enterococcus]MBS7578432.1 sugar ABC transporter permease [Enterococcus sp. MMGLQ5-2]MBS7585663.1 sugar ABC transporter permease [Enterococcus sp. MMGLQ5-1]NPD13522.1 sugar ABC transporter permease [Enterococcus sp. MMGLQ5-1]NPD38264.1 sugar ABC transporter permease [Enterococcus sp. MMGLQ5-2]
MKKTKAPYFFIAPAVALLLIFSIVPIFIALIISFTDLSLAGLADFSRINFVGLENYINIFSDATFGQAVFNTGYYVLIGVPLVVIFSLALAIMINFGNNKFFQFLRLVFYSPSITNTVAIAVVWMYLYNPTIGLINHILNFFNLDSVMWLTDPSTSKIALIIIAVWKGTGLNMLIFLAAIQGIPKAYYEAAEIDGANKWQQIFKITIPLLKFSLFFVSVTTLIGWFQFFEEPFVMTKGGPLDSTLSVALFIYQNGFQYSKFGYAAAGSFVLFVAIILVTIIQLKIQNKQKANGL